MQNLVIPTTKAKQVVDITDYVNDILAKKVWRSGLLHIFLKHSTAALTTADLDPGTDLDMLDAFEKLIPKLKYRHAHNPSHVSDHILSSLIGTSLIIPVQDRRLILGIWQRVVLIEFNGPRKREIILHLVGEKFK